MPAALSTPSVSSSPRKYPIHVEGTARVFTTFLPVDAIDQMDEPCKAPPRQVFMYAWIDKENGVSSHVSEPFSEDGGRFAFKMEIKDGDSPALKLHASLRTQDQESKNFRTFPLAVSCSDLEALLQGGEDSFCMEDQFMEGNFVSVTLRVKNADQYRNHLSCLTDQSKPFIGFGSTALDRIAECNEIMARISSQIQKNIVANKMVDAPGFANFKMGLTRCEPPPPTHLAPPLLFVSLFLGTPAYILLLQSGIRRAEVLGGCTAGQQDGAPAGEGDGRAIPAAVQGHPHAGIPLRRHARAGGDLAARAPAGARVVPSPLEASALRGDCRVHAEAGRRWLWNPFRAGPAVYLRPWAGPLPEGWNAAPCLQDSGDSSVDPPGGSWLAS